MERKNEFRSVVSWTLKRWQVLPAGEGHLRQKEHRDEGTSGVFMNPCHWGKRACLRAVAGAEEGLQGTDLRARYALLGSLGLILQAGSCERFEGILEGDEWMTLERGRKFHMGHPEGSF